MTWPFPSSIEEASAALDQLHQAEQARRHVLRQRLEASVAALAGFESQPEPDEPAVTRHAGRADRLGSRLPDPEPYVSLPRRTTRGGPFGPVVRAKLIAAALEKRAW